MVCDLASALPPVEGLVDVLVSQGWSCKRQHRCRAAAYRWGTLAAGVDRCLAGWFCWLNPR